MNLLELFKGTGSVGKVAKKLGYNVVSLDYDEKFKPDIQTDILKWNYKKFVKDTGFIPDFIWMSPPCNTFSILAYPFHERNTKTAEPYSDRAKLGTKILYRSLTILNYFKKLNPKLKYTIENPRGMMRHDKRMKKLPNMETTLYCLYGDIKYKPTDFWSNFKMNLKPVIPLSGCRYKPVTKLKLTQRYSIPGKLIKQILTQSKKNKIIK